MSPQGSQQYCLEQFRTLMDTFEMYKNDPSSS